MNLAGSGLLLLEDEPLLRKTFVRHLEKLGLEVTAVASLAEARRALQDLSFDFALLDVNLPDGRSLSLLADKALPQHTVPIVRTAEGGISGAVEAMRLGAADYLVKPFDLEELAPRFARARRARQTRRGDEFRRATEVEEEALSFLAGICEGDARKALNALEIAVLSSPLRADGVVQVSRGAAEESIQKKGVVYDKGEDEHYDTISAFIKSVRGSDPDAAVYWLAKMLVAGEDPRFIARRLVILASEDIGNADPRGLSIAVAAMQAVEFVGMPEAQLSLSQATTYLATAPKSNAATLAIGEAMADIRSGKVLPVPRHLRDAHYAGSKALGHVGYVYAHDQPHHFADQEYAPTDKIYYRPSDQGYEATIDKRLAFWDSLRKHPRRDGHEQS